MNEEPKIIGPDTEKELEILKQVMEVLLIILKAKSQLVYYVAHGVNLK